MKEYYSPVNLSDGSFSILELNSYISRISKVIKGTPLVQYKQVNSTQDIFKFIIIFLSKYHSVDWKILIEKCLQFCDC